MGTAFIFPGQGSQHVGMGAEIVEREKGRELFQEASEILGFDLAKICVDGPVEELTRSNVAQPAIFVHSVAVQRALQVGEAVSADQVAGLSSGEWAALHAAGVVTFADAIRILKARGEFMQEVCETSDGGMLAVIGLAPESLDEIAARAGISVANYNSPQQTVLSGVVEGIDAAVDLCQKAGAKITRKLDVAGAFHSPLMQPAADRFAEFLQSFEFQSPSIPVWSNATGQLHEPDQIASQMAIQISSPVQWVKNVQGMAAAGIDAMIECGPGNVLTGLVKRIDRSVQLQNV